MRVDARFASAARGALLTNFLVDNVSFPSADGFLDLPLFLSFDIIKKLLGKTFGSLCYM